MDQLRFDAGLGNYSISVAPDSVWISKGMGTHDLQIQVAVGIPQVGTAAGRLLCLETTLYAPRAKRPASAASLGERICSLQPRWRRPAADTALPHY